ncbi:MAG TPA: signal peptidase I [Acetobacteraceae bacterium]|nr:signal peptidase I [Acetobacteraceae bacterium]
MASTKTKSKTRSKSGGLLDNVKTLVYAGLIAIGIRTFVLEPFNIPSGSMIPTLLVGDYLFVEKYSYGYSRYSFPFSPPLFSGRIFGSMPRRGDVAVFALPRDPSIDYIKRIVGLPGDTMQVIHSRLYINGKECPRRYDGMYMETDQGPPIEVRRYIETLPNGVQHSILQESNNGPLDNTGVYKVPPGFVFAMGDNRDNSEDSRVLSAVGYIPIENLVGKAEFIFFSVDAQYPWWEFWEWPFEIRWGRLFHIIH